MSSLSSPARSGRPQPPTLPFAHGTPPVTQKPRLVPSWDKDQGILHWLGQEFRLFWQDAEAQGPLLDAFQASGWALQIRNPFPRPRKKETRERLHGACKHLNRTLKGLGLRFGVRHKGKWVYWELLA